MVIGEQDYFSTNFFTDVKNQLKINGSLATLKRASSGTTITISRGMIEFIMNEMNVTNFLKMLKPVRGLGNDDFYATLNTNEVLEIPGGYTQKCLDMNRPHTHISGYVNNLDSRNRESVYRMNGNREFSYRTR